MKIRTLVSAGLLAGLAMVACSKPDFSSSGGPPTAPTHVKLESIPQSAKDVYQQRCVTCHGESGLGNGPAGAALNPKPRNFSDRAWQKTVTDDQIRKTIQGGGGAVGKSPLMPPNPDLAGSNKADVVTGLVKIVRAFGQ